MLKTQLLLQMTIDTKLCALLFYFVFKRLTPSRNARHFFKCCQIVLLRLRTHNISNNVQKQFEKKNEKIPLSVEKNIFVFRNNFFPTIWIMIRIILGVGYNLSLGKIFLVNDLTMVESIMLMLIGPMRWRHVVCALSVVITTIIYYFWLCVSSAVYMVRFSSSSDNCRLPSREGKNSRVPYCTLDCTRLDRTPGKLNLQCPFFFFRVKPDFQKKN